MIHITIFTVSICSAIISFRRLTFSQMQFSKVNLAALMAIPPVVLGSPLLDGRQDLDRVTCQTSSGSPTSHDVTLAINQLKGEPSNFLCINDNNSDSRRSPTHRNLFLSLNCIYNRLHYLRTCWNGRDCPLRRRVGAPV